jgi:hypothetical protein
MESEGRNMNEFFDVAILYAGVFLLGLGLPWFYQNPLWDRIDPWKNKKQKPTNKKQTK